MNYPELLVIPFDPTSSSFAEGEAINITGEYPNGRKKEYKGLSGKFERDKFSDQVALTQNQYFIYKAQKEIHFAIGLVYREEESSKTVAAIQDIFRVLISDELGNIDQTGFPSSTAIKRCIYASPLNVLNFLAELSLARFEGDLDIYKGNLGQIEMAKELGGINLGHLYSLASGLGLVEELEWTQLNTSYEQMKEFMYILAEDIKKYEGNRGQLDMAKELGGIHLGHLYSLASGLGLVEDIRWTKIDVPYEQIGRFEKLLEEGIKRWKGNIGQIEMAKALGKMHLRQLHSLASGLGLVEELEWTCMNVTYEQVGKFEELLEEGGIERWKGNIGQIEMAKALGKMNLGQLYSLASGLGLVGELEWTYMNVSYEIGQNMYQPNPSLY